MAHDFMIRVKDGLWKKRTKTIFKGEWNGMEYYDIVELDEYKNLPKDEVFFYGYAGGIFYKAFHCENHDMCLSGDEEIIMISYKRALAGLKTAIELFNQINYPDPSRIDEIKEFYERMETDYKDQWFEICFS